MADLNREQPDDPLWLQGAFKELRAGVKEVLGVKDNPRIEEYLKTTTIGRPGNEHDETAWCSAFVSFCIENAGLEGTKSALARSWLEFGKKIDKPVRGCIAVFERPEAGPGQGHVGFYLGGSAPHITILAGNSGAHSNAVTIAVHNKPLLGFRLPEGGLSMADAQDILKRMEEIFHALREGTDTNMDSLKNIRGHVVDIEAEVKALKAEVKALKDAHA
jgi:uncharacterized protein (TIGR02594 family)